MSISLLCRDQHLLEGVVVPAPGHGRPPGLVPGEPAARELAPQPAVRALQLLLLHYRRRSLEGVPGRGAGVVLQHVRAKQQTLCDDILRAAGAGGKAQESELRACRGKCRAGRLNWLNDQVRPRPAPDLIHTASQFRLLLVLIGRRKMRRPGGNIASGWPIAVRLAW